MQKSHSFGIRTVDIQGILIYCIRLGFKITPENHSLIEKSIRENVKTTVEDNPIRINTLQYYTSKSKIIVQSTTTDYTQHQNNIKTVMSIAKDIAQNNLNQKYSWLNQENYESNNN
jgi:hypothetical protein